MAGGYSDNLAEHQLNTDPGGLGTEVLSASLADELEQLRFCIKRITGESQWYVAPAVNLSAVGGTINDLIVADTVSLQGDLSPAQITADQNNYGPTGHEDVFRFRLSTDATRNITGLSGGINGRVVVLANVGGSFDMVLVNESAASTAANRFALGSNVAVRPNRAVALQYDATSSRWRLFNSIIPTSPVFDGNITMLGNLGTVINLTQTGYHDVAEIAAPANPAANSIRWYAKDVAGISKAAYRDSAGLETLVESAARARIYGEYALNTNITITFLTNHIPFDDTIPQISEGVQIISINLPALKSASSRVRFQFSCFGAISSIPDSITVALFKDADANAIYSTGIVNSPGEFEASFAFEFAPGGAGASTYSIRIGTPTTNTIRLNGTLSARRYGGVAKATLVAEEVVV
jgi:hypothetical protein